MRETKGLGRRSSSGWPAFARAGSGGRLRWGRRFASASEGGFTLIELLVVIGIILILMALLVVLIGGVIERGQYAKTTSIIKLLDNGCATYKMDFGIFPPNDQGDSRCFHKYLGRKRVVDMQKVEQGPPIRKPLPPIIEFRADMLLATGTPDPDRPVPVIDTWEQPIRYKNPGQYNKRSVDIWSAGKNGKDDFDPAAPAYDDVSNWNKEF